MTDPLVDRCTNCKYTLLLKEKIAILLFPAMFLILNQNYTENFSESNLTLSHIQTLSDASAADVFLKHF